MTSGDGGRKGNGGGGNGKRDRKKLRCHLCKFTGHFAKDCKTDPKDYMQQCGKCGGWGHSEKECANGEKKVEEGHMFVVCNESNSNSV